MNKVTVNGTTVEVPSGTSVSVVNGKVYVDNKLVVQVSSGSSQTIRINSEDAFNITTDCDVLVEGDLNGSAKCKDLQCVSVGGSVTADGSVKCNNIGGSVKSGGNVACNNVGGSINAQKEVSRYR